MLLGLVQQQRRLRVLQLPQLLLLQLLLLLEQQQLVALLLLALLVQHQLVVVHVRGGRGRGLWTHWLELFTEGDVALLGGTGHGRRLRRCWRIGVRVAGQRRRRLDGHHFAGAIGGGGGVGGFGFGIRVGGHGHAGIADGNAVRLNVHGCGEGLAWQAAVVQVDLAAVRGRRRLGNVPNKTGVERE